MGAYVLTTILYDVIERLYIARHVRFNEAQFSFDIPKITFPPSSKTSPYYSSESPYVIPITDHPSPFSPRSPISSPSSVSHLSPTSQTSPKSSNSQPSPVSTTSIPTPPPPTPTPPPPPITRQRPANLRQNPKQRVSYNPFANHAIVLPTTITEPTSFTVANNSPKRRQAMKEEYDALMKNGTWSLVPRASNTNVVDGKWVYKLKRDKNGAITRYKATFVAKGFRQQPGRDRVTYCKEPTTCRYFTGLEKAVLSSKLGDLEVCQYMHAPIENHWSAVKRILRYLRGTVEHGMLIRCSSGSTLQVFTDVLWKEAEYKALADTVAELTWLQALLNELGIRSSSTPILWRRAALTFGFKNMCSATLVNTLSAAAVTAAADGDGGCGSEATWILVEQKGSRTREGNQYKLWYSGSATAQNGVGVVVAPYLKDKVVQVFRISDRIMLVRLVIEEELINVISAYAPQVGLKEAEKKSFWDLLDDLVRECLTTQQLIIAGDLNGHIGANADGFSSVHGGFGYGVRNEEGRTILEFAAAHDLVVTNSFFKKRDAHLSTFHSRVYDTQIDYMLVRKGDLRLCKDCKVFSGKVCFSQHKLLALDIHIKR
nr:hypothetical protein [Tanacetum cinerariifolium]